MTSKDKARLKAIQRTLGIAADGEMGPDTLGALELALGFAPPVLPTPDVPLTKRTLENLSEVHPVVREKVVRLLASAAKELPDIRVEVISGLRSWEKQAALYAQGRTKPGRIVTNAPPGSSWHNYGLAVDFGLFDKAGTYLDAANPKLADKVYTILAAHARKLGMEWAGNWTTFKETPHFQFTGTLSSIAAAKKKLASVGGDLALILA